jgi:hypothetical protein
VANEIDPKDADVAAKAALALLEAERAQPSSLTRGQEEELVRSLTATEASLRETRERVEVVKERSKHNAKKLRDEMALCVTRARALAERLSNRRSDPATTDLLLTLAFLEGEMQNVKLPDVE